MKQEVYEREMDLADVQGDIRANRGINWAVISFALIILTIIIGLLGATFFSGGAPKIMQESTNTSGAPVQPK
jgi:hypothetical protein